MNIFVTSPNPNKCALYLDDKRVVKMCLEAVQLLCTSVNYIFEDSIAPCKSTHVNHPCAIWARKSYGNYIWLRRHAIALFTEYTKRYKRTHAYTGIINELDTYINPNYSILDDEVGILTNNGGKRWITAYTPFENCAANNELGVSFKDVSNVFVAYRNYLVERWKTDKRTPTWYGWSYPKLNKEYHNVFQLIEEDYGNE